MREELSYLTFFDLEGFEFADLFKDDEPVWRVIERLENYVALLFGYQRVKRVSPRVRKEHREDFTIIERNVSIGEGTKIYPHAFIGDGVVIGRNCLIGQNTTLRGPLILGDGCVVGPSSEIVGSIFLPGARAAHKNFVAHSIVGRDVNLGAGAETANVKLDLGLTEVSIKTEEGKVFTGLRKFGAVIGDGCSIGGNAVFSPGTLLGKDCRVGSNVPVPNRYFPEGTVIYLPESALVVKRTE